VNEAEFDRFADEYEAQHRANIAISGEPPEFFAAYKIAELARLSERLSTSPRRILDFGSGIGNSVPFFRQYFAESELTCADASNRSLDLSRRRFPGPERYLLVEGRVLPAENDVFDIVFSACVFHHIRQEEHSHWLEELRRVTRPGGLLVIFEHNPLNPLTVHAVNTCPFDENARLIRAGALVHALDEAGWSESTARYHLFFPHALAALRPAEKHLGWLPLGAQYSATARKR
jgi:SAM-dependent methyltransferase